MDWIEQLLMLLNVGIASALTGLVGIERERVDKPAGIRTNMIIGGASCLLISLTEPLIEFLSSNDNPSFVNADPIRVLNALIVGVSFVGAGTILKLTDKKEVHGLTTAATLLFSSGIGISIALHQYVLGVGITLLTVFINYVLPRFLINSKGNKE